MNRIYVFIAALLWFSNIAIAQQMKERRVYYVDCSYSMKQNKVWNLVRDNLKIAIDGIEDETTELFICPYAYDLTSNTKVYRELATKSGKDKLKAIIEKLPMTTATKTYHEMPLRDFYKDKASPDRVTYFFLMTDGVSDHIAEGNRDPFPAELKKWKAKYDGKNVYGFYVMLHPSALKYKAAIDVIGEKETQRSNHLWAIESADVNINLIRLNRNAVFNARTEKYLEIPVFGEYEGKKFSAKFPKESDFYVEKSSVINGKLRIHVKVAKNVHTLPPTQKLPLELTMSGGGDFDFLITEKVMVECISKPEKTLKISIR